MDQDIYFRAFLLVSFIAFIVLRIIFYKKTGIAKKGFEDNQEGWFFIAVLFLLAISWFGSIVLFVAAPGLVRWAAIPLPLWARCVGVALSLVSFAMMGWILSALGKNFSGSLYVREDHSLIKHGPYRLVRHPMYSTIFTAHVATLLTTANWFIGGAGLSMIVLMVLVRVPREEAMLIGKFGDQYREYMRITRRFVPGLLVLALALSALPGASGPAL